MAFGIRGPPMNMWGNAILDPLDPFSNDVDYYELMPWLQENYNRGWYDGTWNNMAVMNMLAARRYRPRRRNHWHSHVHLPVGVGHDYRLPGAYGAYGAFNAGFGGGLGAYGGAYGGIGGGFGGHLAGGFGGGFLPGGNVLAAPQLLIGAPGVQVL